MVTDGATDVGRMKNRATAPAQRAPCRYWLRFAEQHSHLLPTYAPSSGPSRRNDAIAPASEHHHLLLRDLGNLWRTHKPSRRRPEKLPACPPRLFPSRRAFKKSRVAPYWNDAGSSRSNRQLRGSHWAVTRDAAAPSQI